MKKSLYLINLVLIGITIIIWSSWMYTFFAPVGSLAFWITQLFQPLVQYGLPLTALLISVYVVITSASQLRNEENWLEHWIVCALAIVTIILPALIWTAMRF